MKISLGCKALAVPSPVWVIGSYGSSSQPNIMVASWGAICCTSPACVSVSLKVSRATYANIVEHEAFTISIPSRAFLFETDFIGNVSGVSINKFSATGLTAVRSDVVDAPYVLEFPLIIECSLLHMLEIGSHTQFIGQIMDVKADEEVLGENGLPSAEKVSPLIGSAGERSYYSIGKWLGQAQLDNNWLANNLFADEKLAVMPETEFGNLRQDNPDCLKVRKS
ncbi:flavin reductase family protein [uncultured Desulfuromusa sp.]|uniref:flavin reductase family protein n=1 Tax=uncultured Desulfuromusa sp. TaxID=219183 RepID=UPI002AA7CD3A|nr:flavin reductase family protein [uncultured Desulfuromusa sp.]